MQLVICPLKINVEKAPSKLHQELTMFYGATAVSAQFSSLSFTDIFYIYVLPYGHFKDF